MAQAILLGVTIVGSASLIVLGALAIFAGVWRRSVQLDAASAAPDHEAIFIFRDGQMIDCSDPARKLLNSLDGSTESLRHTSVWTLLRSYLAPRFPGLDQALAGLAGTGQFELTSVTGDGLVLTAQFHKGVTQLRLNDTSAEGALLAIDRLSFDALQAEVKTLRAVARHSPALVWKTDSDGQVIWANTLYIKTLLADTALGELTWPLPALFDTNAHASDQRLSLARDAAMRWFAHTVAPHGEETLHFAFPIDAAVQSEAGRRETLQMLTRTFASLPIGLAMFDTARRLQVFNPALVDLTGMDPAFLTAKPSFEQVLYTLRENRMLPEPKDFQNWRREIIEMEKAAETGQYSEEWCLDSGRTFHVTGHPQPNGAIALFIQDVTTEAALTRSFQGQIEIVHKVLDGLSEGIAVLACPGKRSSRMMLMSDCGSEIRVPTSRMVGWGRPLHSGRKVASRHPSGPDWLISWFTPTRRMKSRDGPPCARACRCHFGRGACLAARSCWCFSLLPGILGCSVPIWLLAQN